MNKLRKESWSDEDFGEELIQGEVKLLARLFDIEENDDDGFADQEEAMRFASLARVHDA